MGRELIEFLSLYFIKGLDFEFMNKCIVKERKFQEANRAQIDKFKEDDLKRKLRNRRRNVKPTRTSKQDWTRGERNQWRTDKLRNNLKREVRKTKESKTYKTQDEWKIIA